MKIDSEYLDIEISPEFSLLDAKMKDGRNVTIWEDGDITISTTDDTRGITMNVEELIEIGRIYKLYRTKRDAFILSEKLLSKIIDGE